MVEPKFVAVVRYDFCAAADEEELLNELERIYDSEPQEHGWHTFGGGGGSHTMFGDAPDIDPDEAGFRYVRTSVEQRVERIIDVTTVAILSTTQVDNIKTWDESRASPYVGELLETLEEISAQIPTVVKTSQHRNPSMVYVEPDEQIDARYDENGGLIPESVYKEGISREFLSKFQIYLHGAATVWGEDIVNAQAMMQRWGILSVLNLTSTCDNIDEEWEVKPLWLRRLSRLVPYLRGFHWLNYRMDQIQEYDNETHGLSELLSNDSNEMTVQALIGKQKTLAERRERWTDLSIKTMDEWEALQRDFGPRGLDSVKTDDIPTVAQDPESPVRIEGETNPLDHYYKQTVELLFQRTEDSIRRVGEKQEQISNLIHDQIQVKAEESNLDLQNSIRNLTIALAGLTLVLVGIEVLPVMTGWIF